MSEPAYEFGVVCEAPADQDTACLLADRVLVHRIDWLEAEMLDMQRQWRGLKPNTSFLLWKSVGDETANAGLKHVVFGHFAGEPGAHDALAARKALLLFSALDRRPDAVLLVRDADKDSDRRKGLEQARADKSWPFEVIIGLAEAKRECWVLTGFDAREGEEDTLKKVEQRLSFHPVRDAHKLTAREHGAKNDAKKALEELTLGGLERVRECLRDTPLETLMQRGKRVGLTQFLSEVCDRLAPLMDPSLRSGK
ncbi:hypothetical protein HJC22_11975 [Corallococcus exiguus]|uniref:hypothetical protein n=1 Tax=Corallococcus TaxID=83461 RepID=UPI000ED74BAC|nr:MULTISPECIES: hypothetical protein [Corallococcus]NNC16439.1 hypothetical protein [Corallococcus exiguus]NRD56892.1 hypothetical protein [Corallococcus exiguus]RKI06179.1 hypothetical protein D7Y15_31505 [Corallococcus sp. AB030]RUO87944.1 hypothetical protein D7Y11_37980 [Corallococcus sp. AB018]